MTALILSYHTIRAASLEARAAAAAAAGFEGIGMNFVGYSNLLQEGWDDARIQDVLDEHGVRIMEVEALRGWSGSGDARARADEYAATAFHLADRFGVRYLQAIGPYEGTIAEAAAAFGELCDRAADHGLEVGLEFLPVISNIPTISTAAEIAGEAGRANGGICVDAWHFTRGEPDWDALAAVDPALIKDLQVNDGPLTPEDDDYLRDCMVNRRAPGEGEFELVRLVQALDSIGAEPLISVEVISDQLDTLPPTEAAKRVADATRQLLTTARA